MPAGPTRLDDLVKSIVQSQTNIGISNPNLSEFVRFLVSSSQIHASYLSGKSPPDTDPVSLDITVVAGNSLIMVSVYPDGRVAWSRVNIRECIGVEVENLAGLSVGTIILGSALNLRIADDSEKEGELNMFLQAVATKAWVQ